MSHGILWVIQSTYPNNKQETPMSQEDELRDVLNEAAKSISDTESNPRTWLAWVVYLLARLEEKATNENPAYKESFVEMLEALQDEIRNRTRTGGWH
jgi:hypothetical protein